MQKLWGTRIGINRVWQGTSPRVLLFEPETVEVSFGLELGVDPPLLTRSLSLHCSPY